MRDRADLTEIILKDNIKIDNIKKVVQEALIE